MLDGKPPKSTAVIRALLKSIQNCNDAVPPGPYCKGLPLQDPMDEKRRVDFECRMLLGKSAMVGCLMGGLFGANSGFALPIILGGVGRVLCSMVLGALIGCLCGVALAQRYVLQRHYDWFGDERWR